MRVPYLGCAKFERPSTRLGVKLRILPALLAILLPAAAVAVEDPRTLGMGTALRADPVGNSAVASNPAGMARGQVYGAQAQYFRGSPGDSNEVGLSIVDSKTQPTLAVGVAYGWRFSDGDAEVDVSGHDGRLAFAHAAIPNQLHLGIGLHYLNLDAGDTNLVDGFTLDAGLLWSLSSAFHIAITGENLIDIDAAGYPRRAGGGFAYTGAMLTADFDVLYDFDTHPDGARPVFAAGGEVFLGDAVPIRFGYRNDTATETQYVSGGLGFVNGNARGSGSQLHVGYRQNLSESDDFLFGIGITMYL